LVRLYAQSGNIVAENNQQFNIQDLAEKWAQGKLTPEEQAYLEKWYVESGSDNVTLTDSRHKDADALKNAMLAQINAQIESQEVPARVRRLWPRIAAAASILLIISIGGYFLTHRQPANTLIAKSTVIVPGSKKAILTLSNGQQINLTDVHKGNIAKQANTNITKTDDDQLVYQQQQHNVAGNQEVVYNIITTPRGGYYPLKLADGTLIILDAASSIKYPVNFVGKERLVEITGQAYFEVKHNAAMPFKVKVKGQVIEDIGTSFNVNAYDDEPALKTTLVEGSVKVTKATESVLLQPGQQAITTAAKNTIQIKRVDLDEVIAWKNGQTLFKDEDIAEIMRQVSRWYDVDLQFQGNQPQRHFVGGISRNANLKDLLKILEFDNIHFTVEGRKLIVKP